MFPAQENLEELIINNFDYYEERLLQAIEHPDELRTLLEFYRHYQISEKVFTKVVSSLNHSKEYEKSFHLLIEAIPKKDVGRYVNARDEEGKIPLEYVGEFQRWVVSIDCDIDGVMTKLLDEGAFLAEKDSRGMPVINQLAYEKVRGYLDGCVTKDSYGTVDFDFKNLVSSRVVEGGANVDVLSFLMHIKSSYMFKDLMAHQVVAMFLIYIGHLKWETHRVIFYANTCFFLIFYSSVCVQVANCYNTMDNTWPFLLVTTSIFACRELFQFVIAPKLYLRTIENYLEITIITFAITASTLEDKSIVDQLIVFVFLFSTFDLLHQTGKHLRLIRYVLLFKTVIKIFAKLSIFIVIIVIAFAISFNILFNNQPPFTDLGVSILKTIVMVTGEYDSDNLDFTHYPFGSHLILVLFIIIVSIVLMNLALGLAVSDIQNMERNSRLHGFIANLEFFHQAESVLLKPKAQVFFDYLGWIHGSLNLSERCTRTSSTWSRLTVHPQSAYFKFTSEIAEEQDKGKVREDLWKLTQMMDARLTSLENQIARLRTYSF